MVNPRSAGAVACPPTSPTPCNSTLFGWKASMRLASGPFLCACLACVILAGCKDEKSTAPAAMRPVRIVEVTPQKLGLAAQSAGRIQSRYVSRVGFQVDGRLVSRDVDVGAVVKKGQKLAQISAVDYQNKVTAARSRSRRGQGRGRPGGAAGGALPHPARTGLGDPRGLREHAQGPAERASPGAVGRSQPAHRAEPAGLHRASWRPTTAW